MKMLSEISRINAFLATHPLTRRRRLSAAARVLRWQITSRTHDEVIVDWIGGTRLAARRGMTGVTGNIYAGLHEFADMAFVLHFLRSSDLFADVGANVGSYTILASGVVRCHTVAFEPDPLTAAALERNVNLNQIANLVEIRVAAVGERHGIVRFSTGLDTENHVVSAVDPSGRDVPIQTLDQTFLDSGRIPALIKLDVEGYEAEVLRGALALLAAPGLKAILTENRSPPVVDALRNAGLTEVAYDAFGHQLVPAKEGPMANALFLRDLDQVATRVAQTSPVRILGTMV
jgi:FkbM family methyltransferase